VDDQSRIARRDVDGGKGCSSLNSPTPIRYIYIYINTYVCVCVCVCVCMFIVWISVSVDWSWLVYVGRERNLGVCRYRRL
jgi:hypothetical protein